MGSAFIGDRDKFSITRYTTDGNIDTTFGDRGSQTTDFGGDYAIATSVVIQDDGKIIVAGNTVDNIPLEGSWSDFAIARYNTDGSDTSFAGNGKQISDFSDYYYNYASSIALQGDGKIIVVGKS